MKRPVRTPEDQARLGVVAIQRAMAHYAGTGNTLQVRLCTSRLAVAQAELDRLVPPAPKPVMPWEKDHAESLAFLAELDARVLAEHEAGDHVVAYPDCPRCAH